MTVENSLAVSSSNALAKLQQILPVRPALLSRCISLGYGPDELAAVRDLAEMHEKRPVQIIRLAEQSHAPLVKIGRALELSVHYHPSVTPSLMLRIVTDLDLQVVEYEEFLSPFEEVIVALGGRYPFHRLARFIDSDLDGDWHEARLMAVEDSASFVLFIKRQIDKLTFYQNLSNYRAEEPREDSSDESPVDESVSPGEEEEE